MFRSPYESILTLALAGLACDAARSSDVPRDAGGAPAVAESLSGTIEIVGTEFLLVQVGGDMEEIDVPSDAAITLNQRPVKLRQLSRGDWVSIVVSPGAERRAVRVDAMKGDVIAARPARALMNDLPPTGVFSGV